MMKTIQMTMISKMKKTKTKNKFLRKNRSCNSRQAKRARAITTLKIAKCPLPTNLQSPNHCHLSCLHRSLQRSWPNMMSKRLAFRKNNSSKIYRKFLRRPRIVKMQQTNISKLRLRTLIKRFWNSNSSYRSIMTNRVSQRPSSSKNKKNRLLYRSSIPSVVRLIKLRQIRTHHRISEVQTFL